jgi:hypothetical protein
MSDKQLSIPSFTGFDGAVTDKGQLSGSRKFIASKLGLNVPKGTKAKEFKAMIQAQGLSENAKALSKEYDSHRREYYRSVNTFNGALAADPRFRKTMKLWHNKAGDVCVNVAYRKEPQLAISAQTRADNAERKIAELEAKLAAVLALKA